MNSPKTIIDFWFDPATRAHWFKNGKALDDTIRQRFGALHRAARDEQLSDWRRTAEGRLAEIIALDQFSRHIHRGSADAFSQDELALRLAQDAVARCADRNLAAEQRAFLYMPYMHSESLPVHEQALQLFAQPGLEKHLKHERQHHAILARFGRYPHRNKLLGRESTPEEEAFLKEPGSSF